MIIFKGLIGGNTYFSWFFLVFIPVVTIIIIRNIYLAYARNKKYWIVLALHALVIAVFFVLTGKGIL
jgi:uncharacterized membrane protein